MNDKIWWYLARGSGIVALALLVLSLVWGILLATRVLRPRDRPAWLLDLHRWFSGTAVVMTALHLTGLFMDGYVGFGAAELFVPGQSSYRPLAVAVGIVSLYVMVAIQATSYLRRWLPVRLWRGVHLLSYLLVWGSVVHAGMAGSDIGHRLYQAVAVLLTAIAAGATTVRVLSPRRRRAATGVTVPA